MVAPVRPASAKSKGTTKIVFVPAFTGAYTAPDVTAAAGASALDVTKMFFESSAMPDASTQMARAPRRVGDVESYEFVGEVQWTIGEMRYAFNPQAAALSDQKKAFEKFPYGTTGYLLFRKGIDRDTDLATGQFVTVYPVEFGSQVETDEGDGDGAEIAIKQGVGVTGTPAQVVALVA